MNPGLADIGGVRTAAARLVQRWLVVWRKRHSSATRIALAGTPGTRIFDVARSRCGLERLIGLAVSGRRSRGGIRAVGRRWMIDI